MAAQSQSREKQIGRSRQQAAQKERSHDTDARGDRAARKGAHQCHDQAEDLAYGRHFLFGKAQIRIEGIGHDAHHHIADAVGGNQRQNHRRTPAKTREEIQKWLTDRFENPLALTCIGLCMHSPALLRLRAQKHRDDAHQHARGHHKIR